MHSDHHGITISLKGAKIMKKFLITFIAIFSITAISLVGIMIHTIKKGGTNVSFVNPKINLVNTQNIDLENIDSISIKYQSDDITFYTSDTNELILKEYMNFNPDKYQLANIARGSNQIKIKGGNRNFNIGFLFPGHYSKTEVYLPSKYAGILSVGTSSGNIDSDFSFSLATFEASSTSGDISVNEIYAEDITISSNSGNITFLKADGKREFSSTSGDIKVFDGTGDSNFSSNSGNITIDKTNGQLKVNASSGDIQITSLSGGGDFNTSSGNLNLEFSEDTNAINDDIKISASSGNVTLKLPSALNFNFTAQTSSGDIRTFYDDGLTYNKKGNHATGTVGDNPDVTIGIKTNSGNIRIQEN